MRINKYLASLGVASRRKVDELIEGGEVTLNGKLAKLGDTIDPTKDKIKVNDEEVSKKQDLIYIALNKPTGYTSTVAKIKGEKNLLELVNISQRIYPVGRLDKDSTGLIFLTNDGEFANRLTHPKFHVPKKYEVKILGNVTEENLKKLRLGIHLEDGLTKPAEVQIINKSLPHDCTVHLTLFEGKKRQIRRIMAALHLHTLNLKRTSIGSIQLGNLPMGKYRKLTKKEINNLVSTNGPSK